MNLDSITSALPRDDRARNFTYVGRRLYAFDSPCYVHDMIRSRPTMVLGSTGYGKTELLLSLAFSDAGKQRPVFFVDGKCSLETLNKLYSYAKLAGRPFYAFMPFQDGDRLTASWNPFVSDVLPISVIADAFINAYADPASVLNRNDPSGAGFYLETQRAVCSGLIRSLHATGLMYCIRDLKILLEDAAELKCIATRLRPEGYPAYGELMRIKGEEGDDFPRTMRRFVNYLGQFNHWAVNSYSPSFTIERIIDEGAVLYAGLPVNTQSVEMSAIGNMLINLLKATSSHLQTKGVGPVKPVSCIVDEAGSFIDSGLAEWICKVRSTNFLLTLGIQTLAQLEGRRKGFGEEIRSNAPNVFMFNPKDQDTAKWFSGLIGAEARRSVTASIQNGSEETGAGSVKLYAEPKVHPDAILSLNCGQCFYSPPVPTDHPPLLAASMLPNPDKSHPLNVYRRPAIPAAARRKGLFLSSKLLKTNFGAGLSAGSGHS